MKNRNTFGIIISIITICLTIGICYQWTLNREKVTLLKNEQIDKLYSDIKAYQQSLLRISKTISTYKDLSTQTERDLFYLSLEHERSSLKRITNELIDFTQFSNIRNKSNGNEPPKLIYSFHGLQIEMYKILKSKDFDKKKAVKLSELLYLTYQNTSGWLSKPIQFRSGYVFKKEVDEKIIGHIDNATELLRDINSPIQYK